MQPTRHYLVLSGEYHGLPEQKHHEPTIKRRSHLGGYTLCVTPWLLHLGGYTWFQRSAPWRLHGLSRKDERPRGAERPHFLWICHPAVCAAKVSLVGTAGCFKFGDVFKPCPHNVYFHIRKVLFYGNAAGGFTRGD